jgi:putative hydrolase of the HAD superfamily
MTGLKELTFNVQEIEAIFFDVNGTLRVRERHDATEQAARQTILQLLNKDDVPDDYWQMLEKRYRNYSNWAQDKYIQLSEAEIWTRWMLPDEPSFLVMNHADELMLAWSERRGRKVPIPGTEECLRDLSEKGYRLGVISNTMSTLDIPRFLMKYNMKGYFSSVVLSSFGKSRKPAPDLFHMAAESIGVSPSRCAYVGNKITKDIMGSKNAGYLAAILVSTPDELLEMEQYPDFIPDLVVN